MANDDQQGIGPYPGPDHSTLSDMLDWSGAHELGSIYRGPRPRLLGFGALGQLLELARQRQAQAIPWHDTGSGPGR